MLEKREIVAGLLIVLLLAVACLLVSLPPHTDPGVDVLEPGVARVHNGETLILWVPSGKTSAKYHFHFENDTVTVTSFLHHDERMIPEGCETFRVSLFYKVEACRDGQNMIFKWDEFFLGVRIDQ
jgi:hypothetical protein